MQKLFLKVPEAHKTFLDHLGGVDRSMGGAPVPKSSIYMGEGKVNISASIMASYTKFFGRFLRHKETFFRQLGGVDTHMDRVPAPKSVLSWANTWGSGEVYISVAIRALYTKFFWEVPETQQNISRPHGGVDTPMGRVLAPKSRPRWANTWGSGEVNMSASIRAPCTNFWRFLRHIGIFLKHLGGVDRPMGGPPVPKSRPRWANTWGSGEVYISASIRVPYTKTFWVVSEIYRNIFRPLGQCWHTHGQSASAQNMSKLSKYMEEGRSICQLLLGLHAPIFEGSWDT